MSPGKEIEGYEGPTHPAKRTKGEELEELLNNTLRVGGNKAH